MDINKPKQPRILKFKKSEEPPTLRKEIRKTAKKLVKQAEKQDKHDFLQIMEEEPLREMFDGEGFSSEELTKHYLKHIQTQGIVFPPGFLENIVIFIEEGKVFISYLPTDIIHNKVEEILPETIRNAETELDDDMVEEATSELAITPNKIVHPSISYDKIKQIPFLEKFFKKALSIKKLSQSEKKDLEEFFDHIISSKDFRNLVRASHDRTLTEGELAQFLIKKAYHYRYFLKAWKERRVLPKLPVRSGESNIYLSKTQKGEPYIIRAPKRKDTTKEVSFDPPHWSSNFQAHMAQLKKDILKLKKRKKQLSILQIEQESIEKEIDEKEKEIEFLKKIKKQSKMSPEQYRLHLLHHADEMVDDIQSKYKEKYGHEIEGIQKRNIESSSIREPYLREGSLDNNVDQLLQAKIESKEEAKESLKKQIHTILDIAKTLFAIHQAGYVHRDLKTDNILLRNGKPIIIDFGMAGKIGEYMEVGGTTEYMAPEQMTDNIITEKTDVYAFGLIMGELLMGKEVFSTDYEKEWSNWQYAPNYKKIVKFYKDVYAVDDEEELKEIGYTYAAHMQPPQALLDPKSKLFSLQNQDINQSAYQKLEPLLKQILGPKAEDRPSMREIIAELYDLLGESLPEEYQGKQAEVIPMQKEQEPTLEVIPLSPVAFDQPISSLVSLDPKEKENDMNLIASFIIQFPDLVDENNNMNLHGQMYADRIYQSFQSLPKNNRKILNFSDIAESIIPQEIYKKKAN